MEKKYYYYLVQLTLEQYKKMYAHAKKAPIRDAFKEAKKKMASDWQVDGTLDFKEYQMLVKEVREQIGR